MPLACFDANSDVSTHWEHNRRTIPLVYFNLLLNLKQLPAKKPFNHQGFFAVKRRAVFNSIHDSATMHNLFPEIFQCNVDWGVGW